MEINASYYERDVLAILATAQDSNRARTVINKLSKDMFASRINKLAYSAIAELSEENEIIDFTSVHERMSSIDNTENNMLYMADMLGDSTGSEALLTSYAKRVRQAYYLRDAQSRVQKANDLIVNLADITKVGVLAGQIDEIFSGLMLETNDQLPVKFKDVAKNYLDELQKKAQGEADEFIIKTNIEDLDNLTGGFNDTDLIIIGGTPGSGKTEKLVSIIKGVTSEPGVGALMFSLEMSNKQLVERAISGSAGLPVSALRNPQGLNENGWGLIGSGLSQIVNNEFYMTDQVGMTVNDIIAIATRHKQDHPNTKLFAVDYAGLLDLDSNKRHDLALGEVSRKLKLAAKELKTPFILLVQLNSKNIDARPLADRHPRASDIKDSSRIEDDADLIMLCYREKVYEERAPDISETILAKARHAVKGSIFYERFINGHFVPARQDLLKNELDSYRSAPSQNKQQPKNF